MSGSCYFAQFADGLIPAFVMSIITRFFHHIHSARRSNHREGRFLGSAFRIAVIASMLAATVSPIAAQNTASSEHRPPHDRIRPNAVSSEETRAVHRSSIPERRPGRRGRTAVDPALYNNGPINGEVDGWMINLGFLTSDTFTIADGGTTARGISFGAWLFPGDVLQTVDVTITSEPLNTGTTYFSGTVSFTASDCFMSEFGFNICAETGYFVLSGLPAGTYWVNLLNATVPSGDPVYWDENSGVGCESQGCPSEAMNDAVGTIPSESFTMLGGTVIPTQTNLSISPGQPQAGQEVTLTATVLAQDQIVGIGTVTFSNGNEVLETVQANNSGNTTAVFKTRFGPGTYSITATYNANDSFQSSVSSPSSLTVTGTEPTVSTLTATPSGSDYDFGLSVFGFGLSPLAGSATVNNLSQGGTLLGNINITGPGTSTFQGPTSFPAGSAPSALVSGDLNGDGIPDLAVTNTGTNTVTVLLGNGHGGFTLNQTLQVGGTPSGIAAFDLNGDGNIDLAVANKSGQSIEAFFGAGNGTFGSATTYPIGVSPTGIAVADFDLNGYPDLAVSAASASGGFVELLNQGNRTFTLAQSLAAGSSPSAVAVGDFNNDGNPDVAIADAQGDQAVVLLGNGDGTFQPPRTFAAGHQPSAIAVADLRNNGHLDMVVTNYEDSTISVFLGDGSGNFSTQSVVHVGVNPDGVAIADFNGDGIPDLAIADAGDNTAEVLLGNGDGTFQPPLVFSVSPNLGPNGIVATDLNGDSVPDLAVSDSGGNGSIFLGGTVSTGQLADIPIYGQGSQTVQSTFTSSGAFYTGSQSNLMQVRGSGFLTTTSLTSAPNPSTYLQTVTITATVRSVGPWDPIGTVNFTDNGTAIPGCIGVELIPQGDASVAVCMTSTLAVGTHADIVGTYPSNLNFVGSAGVLRPPQVVNRDSR